jgi:hypothetical protein
MNKYNLTNLKMIYIMYCKIVTGFLVDALCVIVVIYMVDNPLDSLFLSGFVYFCVYIIIRIPMMLYYHDV